MSENTVFTMSHWRDVHEIIVKTKGGRVCSILIHDDGGGAYDTNVLISDPVAPSPRASDYRLKSTSPTSTPKEHFRNALRLIEAYLAQFAPGDEMVDFWNPCNAPYVSPSDQADVLSMMGIKQQVRVN